MLYLFKRLLGKAPTSKADTRESQSDIPMERWSEDKLQATKASLGSKTPDQWKRSDHHAVADYIVQQYLPRDDVHTEKNWQEARAQLHAKIDKDIQRAEQGLSEEPAWQRTNRELERRRELLKSSYSMSKFDFEKTIVPVLAQFAFCPEVSELTARDIDFLWFASGADNPDIPWEPRYAVRDAKDYLQGRFHPVVLETCTALRFNYEVLRRFRNAGSEEVKLLVKTGCRCFGDILDGVHIKVADALTVFEGQSADVPLLPPPQAPCVGAENPRICQLHLISVEPSEVPEPETAAEFQVWLDEALGTRRLNLPQDWELRLRTAEWAAQLDANL